MLQKRCKMFSINMAGDVVGVVTTGNDVTTGSLPSLESISPVLLDGQEYGSAQSTDAIENPLLNLETSLKGFAATYCMALLKTSLAIQGSKIHSLRITSAGGGEVRGVTVAAVHTLSYPTYDKDRSPCPPVDKSNKSKELSLVAAALAAAVGGEAIQGAGAIPGIFPNYYPHFNTFKWGYSGLGFCEGSITVG
jgi:hypothetical protein